MRVAPDANPGHKPEKLLSAEDATASSVALGHAAEDQYSESKRLSEQRPRARQGPVGSGTNSGGTAKGSAVARGAIADQSAA